MADHGSRGTSKVYCTMCDQVFGSREQYERHVDRCRFSGDDVSCESCPIDTAISRLARFFKRR